MTVSKHYEKERFLRENIIKFIGGEGKIIKEISVSLYEKIYITDNCVAIFYNPVNDVLITKYVMTKSQLRKMYADAPKDLILKAIKYQKMGVQKF